MKFCARCRQHCSKKHKCDQVKMEAAQQPAPKPEKEEVKEEAKQSALNPQPSLNPNSKKPSDKFLVIAKVFQDIEQAAECAEEIIEIGVETLGELTNDLGFIQNMLNHPNVQDLQAHVQLMKNGQGQGYDQRHLKFTVKLQKSGD